MKEFFTGAGAAALILVAVACNGGSTVNPPHGVGGTTAPGVSYQQIELLSRPAVKEAFESFADHDATNRTEPYNDPTIQADIGNFTTMVAGRSTATAAALQSVLYPNEMVADLSQSAPTAAYLGVETGGVTGSKFGGRALSDDVIDISLGAIFGNTLSALGVVPDDGKESPCLTTDHVGYAATNSSTFPYAQGPI